MASSAIAMTLSIALYLDCSANSDTATILADTRGGVRTIASRRRSANAAASGSQYVGHHEFLAAGARRHC